MAFGLSGSGEQTLMLNADITVAYYDSDTPNAVDFNINGYAQVRQPTCYEHDQWLYQCKLLIII